MIVKGIVSAINIDDKKVSVILPEYGIVTRPIPVYGGGVSTLSVDDFVVVLVFNDDFNDCMILPPLYGIALECGDNISY